jgi:hypothetical protein
MAEPEPTLPQRLDSRRVERRIAPGNIARAKLVDKHQNHVCQLRGGITEYPRREERQNRMDPHKALAVVVQEDGPPFGRRGHCFFVGSRTAGVLGARSHCVAPDGKRLFFRRQEASL